MAKPQYSGPWRRIRLQVLDRDSHLCQIQGPRCTRRATEVDHIVAIEAGGTLDPRNLRASCRPCNLDRRHQDLDTAPPSRAW